MEREKIIARTAAGCQAAAVALAATGKTHRGKESMGRPAKADNATVLA